MTILFGMLHAWLSFWLPGMQAAPGVETAATDSADAFPMASSSMDFTWLFLKTLFAMVVVLGLAVFILRYLLPKLAVRRRSGQRHSIEVVERVALDPKSRLFVVKVEGRHLLLSGTDQAVHFLTELRPDHES